MFFTLRLLLLVTTLACVVLSVISASVDDHAQTLRPRDDNLPARVPYVFPSPGTNAIADEIRSRRANGTLLDLDGVLLQAPLVAQGEDVFAGVIRDNNSIPATMRELIILRVAVLNSAAYEWLQHEPVGRSAGLTTADLLSIRFAPAFSGTINNASSLANSTNPPQFANATLSPSLSAAMEFTDWSTKSVFIPQPVFDNLHAFLNDTQIVEAMATAAFYNFVSRFVVGMNVDDKMGVMVPIPS